jgi:hypothetical protein
LPRARGQSPSPQALAARGQRRATPSGSPSPLARLARRMELFATALPRTSVPHEPEP